MTTTAKLTAVDTAALENWALETVAAANAWAERAEASGRSRLNGYNVAEIVMPLDAIAKAAKRVASLASVLNG